MFKGLLLALLCIFLLYIRRFRKDFDDEQVSIFSVACGVVVVIILLLTWMSSNSAT